MVIQLPNYLPLTFDTFGAHNAALRCERRLAILERSENAKRRESLLNALLSVYFTEGSTIVESAMISIY